jgi:hypothetical protein
MWPRHKYEWRWFMSRAKAVEAARLRHGNSQVGELAGFKSPPGGEHLFHGLRKLEGLPE